MHARETFGSDNFSYYNKVRGFWNAQFSGREIRELSGMKTACSELTGFIAVRVVGFLR